MPSKEKVRPFFSLAIVTVCQSLCQAPVAELARENGLSSCCLSSPSCARAWRQSSSSEAFLSASRHRLYQLPQLLASSAALSAASFSTPSPPAPVSNVFGPDAILLSI